jgi:hypothetical protein
VGARDDRRTRRFRLVTPHEPSDAAIRKFIGVALTLVSFVALASAGILSAAGMDVGDACGGG